MKWEVHRLLNSNRYLASVTNNPARKPDLDLSHYKAHATSIVPHCPQQAHLDPHFVYSEVFCFFLLFLSSSLPLPCQKKKKKRGGGGASFSSHYCYHGWSSFFSDVPIKRVMRLSIRKQGLSFYSVSILFYPSWSLCSGLCYRIHIHLLLPINYHEKWGISVCLLMSHTNLRQKVCHFAMTKYLTLSQKGLV